MKLFYRKTGSGNPILFLHGLFGSADNWVSIAAGLRDAGQIYLLDLRNHGRSPHSNTFDYTVMVEDVYEFLGDLNLRQVTMVGHSMGGMITMQFALSYPHRINKLVVIDIAPRSYPIHHRNIVDGLLSIDINRLKSREEADDQLSRFVDQPRVRQFLLKNLYRNTGGKFGWRLNLRVIAQNLSMLGMGIDSMKTCDNSCLFIRAALSDFIRDADETSIKKLFPRAGIVTVEDTTHWLLAENPAAVTAIIKSFLNENKSLH
jgi:pimeloyl-ACP methyl ester carboxylesterase